MGKSLINSINISPFFDGKMMSWERECDWLKRIYEVETQKKKKERKIKTFWHGDDVAQLEHSNNKCYALTFRYI